MTMNIDQFKKLLAVKGCDDPHIVGSRDFLFMGNVGGLPHEMAVAYKELFPV